MSLCVSHCVIITNITDMHNTTQTMTKYRHLVQRVAWLSNLTQFTFFHILFIACIFISEGRETPIANRKHLQHTVMYVTNIHVHMCKCTHKNIHRHMLTNTNTHTHTHTQHTNTHIFGGGRRMVRKEPAHIDSPGIIISHPTYLHEWRWELVCPSRTWLCSLPPCSAKQHSGESFHMTAAQFSQLREQDVP